MAITAEHYDWSKPAAVAIPKEGFFEHKQGRYGPVFPRTPANRVKAELSEMLSLMQ